MATCGFLRSNCSVILMSHKDKGPPFLWVGHFCVCVVVTLRCESEGNFFRGYVENYFNIAPNHIR